MPLYYYIAIICILTLVIAWAIVRLLRKEADFERTLNFVFLRILIPKKESKDDQDRDQNDIQRVIGVAEHFFTTLHGIHAGDTKAFFRNEDYLSLEYIATNEEIEFYMGCPSGLKELIEKQITTFYPDAVVEEVEAPHVFREHTAQATGHITASKDFWYPFKTYKKFESADPVNNILNALSSATNEHGDSAAVQFMIRPVKNDWQGQARKTAKALASGKSEGSSWNIITLLGNLISFIVRGSEETAAENSPKESDESQELTKSIEEKAEKSAFETIIRVVTSAPQQRIANVNLTTLKNAFTQYGTPSLNSFGGIKWHSKRALIRNFIFRSFKRSLNRQNKIVLSSEELASLYHFPHIKYNQVPGIKWQNFKIVKTPANVPKEGLLLGHNNYRGEKTPIYMKREDRFRHFYVIGQTGTGKSSIFQTMIRQDLRNGDGLCVIDPHGSLIEDLLPFVPKERVDDVIIFDPSDLERPMGLNLLEADTEEEKDMLALDAMNIMIKMFDEEVFGPRIQDYFRNGVLTLMANPNGGSLTDIVRLFTDDAFQKSISKHVTNPIVKSFWEKQMAKTGAREKQEMIPYFASKFGAFVTNAMMRNIIGQTKSSFNFAKVMSEQKILFMNLSKGATGDINSKLLGLIIVAKIQMAAPQRQKMPKEDRKDFFLYIDEFQNYVTDSIESILSEARKYRLSLNIAHQYISQIDTSGQKKGVNLKDAVFGNIGTMMCYKIGTQDAEIMGKEMAPVFTDQDLINIDAFKATIKLAIDGQPCRPFSMDVIKPWLETGDSKMAKVLKQISRLTHGRSRKFVEKEIFTRLDV